MIHFMLDGDRFKTAGADLSPAAVRFAELHGYFGGPLNIAGIIRHAHAPFPHDGNLASTLDDFRIDHAQKTVVVIPALAIAGYVHNADPHGNPDLRGCHADRAGPIAHGIHQILNQAQDALINLFDPVRRVFSGSDEDTSESHEQAWLESHRGYYPYADFDVQLIFQILQHLFDGLCSQAIRQGHLQHQNVDRFLV